MSSGYFISFEGLDGSGKTTQLRRLAQTLEAAGHSVTTLRQPGGTSLGDRLRSLLLDSRNDATLGPIGPASELALLFADRAQTISQVIAPALRRGSIVLCDRFTDSSEAYQGAGRELGSERVLALHRALCDDLQPDMTILLLPPLAISLRRARRRNQRQLERFGADENRFENEPDTFYERVYAGYDAIAARDAYRIVTIRSDAAVDAVETEIRAAVLRRLPCRVESVV